MIVESLALGVITRITNHVYTYTGIPHITGIAFPPRRRIQMGLGILTGKSRSDRPPPSSRPPRTDGHPPAPRSPQHRGGRGAGPGRRHQPRPGVPQPQGHVLRTRHRGATQGKRIPKVPVKSEHMIIHKGKIGFLKSSQGCWFLKICFLISQKTFFSSFSKMVRMFFSCLILFLSTSGNVPNFFCRISPFSPTPSFVIYVFSLPSVGRLVVIVLGFRSRLGSFLQCPFLPPKETST